MRIAVFHNLPPGGAKRVIYEEVKFLSKNNELELFELDSTDEKFMDITKFFKKVHKFKFSPEAENRLLKDYKNFIVLKNLHKKIAQKIDNSQFDLVLIHPDKLTQSPFLLKFIKTKSIYYCEELLRIAYEEKLAFKDDVSIFKIIYERITRQIRKKIDKDNARCATKILVSSNFIKAKVKKAYKREAEIVRLGVDTKIFKNKNIKKDNTLLFIGEPNEINGFSLVKDLPNLKVIGKLNLTDNKLSNLYAKSFLTLCVSYDEPFGLSSLESMASGTPILAVNEGGYKESVVNGKTGYLLNRKKYEFLNKIIYLQKNPKIYKNMSKFAVKYVKENWTWQKHNENLQKHFQ